MTSLVNDSGLAICMTPRKDERLRRRPQAVASDSGAIRTDRTGPRDYQRNRSLSLVKVGALSGGSWAMPALFRNRELTCRVMRCRGFTATLIALR